MEMERIIRECAFDVFRGEELRFDASAAAERAVVAPQELTVRVAAGVAARLSLLHAAASSSEQGPRWPTRSSSVWGLRLRCMRCRLRAAAARRAWCCSRRARRNTASS